MINDFISLLFPRTCELCHRHLSKGENHLCIRCRHSLPVWDFSMIREEMERHLIECHRYSHFYTYLKYFKKGITQKLLYLIKYADKPYLAEDLGKWLGTKIRHFDRPFAADIIIPVPLHPGKRRRRGYNQSEYFATGLSESLNVAHEPELLIRTIDNDTQTNKSREQRFENVRGIFRVRDPSEITGMHILLVDDVVTTGATLESCADVLEEANAGMISIATMAIAK